MVNLGTMSFAGKKGVEKAFAMLRTLPRICLANIRRNPGTRIRVNYTNDYSLFWVFTNQRCIKTWKSEHSPTPPRAPEFRISVMFDVHEDKIDSVHITVWAG